MAKAKYLADVDNNKIYPVGHTRAVYDDNGTVLEDRLTSDEQKITTEATERKNADNTKVNINGGDVSKTVVSFTQSSTRTDITSGDTVSTLFGKIKKWFADLKTVAWTGNYSDLTNRPLLFSGSYNDLSNKPSSFTPSSHAVSTTTYGVGSSSNYGHVKLSDSTDSTSDVSDGIAATPSAVKAVSDKVDKIQLTPGPQGEKGADGKAATITIGIVTTGSAGSSAKVVNSGTENAAKLDFTIPKGADGKNGTNGTNGTSAAWFTGTAISGTGTKSVNVSGAKAGDMYLNTMTADVYKASSASSWTYQCNIRGATGAQGSTGAKGDKGERGVNATLVVAASNSSAKSKAAADYTCTGSSDQSTINSAISALPSGGGKIVLLEGTYNISGSINVNKDNVTIEGMGNGTVLKRMFNDSTSNEWNGGIIYADAHKNIIISDISFDGNQSSYTGQYNGSIKFSNASHCIIKNTYHSNVRGTAIAIFGGSSENNVVNNIVQSSLRYGIHLYYATNNIIQGNMVMNTEKGVVLEYYANNNKISGNYIMRGTGTSGDYTTSQYTIQIANGTYNDVSDNYIMGKNYVNNGGSTNVFDNNIWDGSKPSDNASITGAASTITSSNLTASRALVSNSSGKVAASDITTTELGYLDGVTSNVQMQLNSKVGKAGTGSGSFIANGQSCFADGNLSFAGGSCCFANGLLSFAFCYDNIALDYQTKFGHAATEGTAGGMFGTDGDAFVIGNGANNARSNAFRVAYSGDVYGLKSFHSSGADYAEFFEWLDGNPDSVDRTGLFVTLDGDKIRLANADDDYILGVVSAAPGVIGNDHADTWQGMWLTDIFGRVLTHTVHHDAEYDDEGNLIHDACDAVEPIVNPDYNPDEKYIPREKRKEWGVVGMMGQLVVIDDGTCKVNGCCKVADGGTATASESGYRVIARLDDTHVKVLFR